MATKTITTYSCDGCEKKAKQSDLRKFVLIEKKANGLTVASAKTDLCTDCERGLHVQALSFFPANEAEKLRGIVR